VRRPRNPAPIARPPPSRPNWAPPHPPSPPLAPQVKANGLIVFVPRYGIEGPLYLTPKDGARQAGGQQQQQAEGQQQQQQFVLDEERQVVTSADGKLRFAVFDKCAVRITVEEGVAHRRSLVLSLVPRGQLPPSELMA
jgi:exosome complex exonuclease DIS3/RRP44